MYRFPRLRLDREASGIFGYDGNFEIRYNEPDTFRSYLTRVARWWRLTRTELACRFVEYLDGPFDKED